MADLTNLNAAIATLNTDVTAFISAAQTAGQPSVDAATAAVQAIDTTVKNATTALNPPA